jgi:hypothetical protein
MLTIETLLLITTIFAFVYYASSSLTNILTCLKKTPSRFTSSRVKVNPHRWCSLPYRKPFLSHKLATQSYLYPLPHMDTKPLPSKGKPQVDAQKLRRKVRDLERRNQRLEREVQGSKHTP